MASSPRIDDLRKKFEENQRRYFAPLANEYRKAGDIAQAIAICREHLPQQPGHMSGHIVFGQALYEAKQFDEGKTVFETALSLDPENLIALRHLGDIALVTGDKEAAKGWYKRVLEADPRNEETQAQLAMLEVGTAAPAKAAPAAAPSPPAPPPAQRTAASAAPTVVMKAVGPPGRPETKPAPAQPPPVTTDSPTAEIRLEGLTHGEPPATKHDEGLTDISATLLMDSPHGVTPVQAHEAPPITATVGLESTAVSSSGETPLESFSLEGLETTSLAAPAPPLPAAPAATPPDLDFGGATEPVAAPVPEPPVAVPALDLDIPATLIAPPPSPAALADETVPIDLDFGAPPGQVADVSIPPADAALPMLEIADSAPPPLPEIALEVPATAAAEVVAEPLSPAPESSPFVTETMAELYLQQGHREEALRVYRALLEERPGDADLVARIASLEPAPVFATAPDAPALHAESAAPVGGPTIRAVLLLVAQRRPGVRPEPIQQNGSSEPEQSYAVAAPVALDASMPSDALGALWDNAAPSAVDETAAMVLAMAFSDLDGRENGGVSTLDLSPGGTPMVMVPARAAGGGPAPASFSFDKFFSERATAEHATHRGGVPGSEVESQADVAKFTQWLEGLKRQ